MLIDSPPAATRSLRRSVAWAFAPLVLVVGAAAVCQVVLARAVHLDVRRLFEELREVTLARALVDELHGISQWLDTTPTATPVSHPLVFTDIRRHHDAAAATLRRFATANDPSTPSHDDQEDAMLRKVADGLQTLARAFEGTGSLADLRTALAGTNHAAATLSATIENESRAIGDDLDRHSDEMMQFLLLLGIVSVATVGGLGWLLLRRVLQPVQELRHAAIRLGRGDLDVPIPQHRDDELGVLATTFRAMANRLREGRNELEARVEQRSREVLRSARLAQLGTLAAGIAHEINNPLASIVAGTEGLLREIERGRTPAGEGTRDYLQILRKEALRAQDITTRLLRFSRQDSPRRQPVWLAAEAREVAALFAHQLQDAGVQLDIASDGDGPACLGDPSEWRQVLFNLLRNALDESPRGGAIRVRIAAIGDEVHLTVADEGGGVPSELQDRIFEPFFTTKEPGKGTGLGLAIVHRIVEAHGGRVSLANGARGACFTITMPAVR